MRTLSMTALQHNQHKHYETQCNDTKQHNSQNNDTQYDDTQHYDHIVAVIVLDMLYSLLLLF